MIRRFLAWLRALFARLFRRAERPGYFTKGKASSLSGQVAVAPFLMPSREYLVYVPRDNGGRKPRTLLVFIHGCKQTPEEFAAGTRIAALADEKGWLVLLPRQDGRANRYGCWNWFDPPTAAGRGEAAILIAQVAAVVRKHRVDPARVFVAGFSSGGALAVAAAVHHPLVFAGAFIHSGIACGAAALPADAYEVMEKGARTDAAKIGERARTLAPGVRLPLLAVHGGQDDVVAPVNGKDVAEQFRALNGGAKELVRLEILPALGHAWSGGDPAYPYNDAAGPDATAMLGEFVDGLPARREGQAA